MKTIYRNERGMGQHGQPLVTATAKYGDLDRDKQFNVLCKIRCAQ